MSSETPVGASDERPIRVVVAEDNYLGREALMHVLSDADGIEVVATCRDRDSLQRAIEADAPDVVVTDIRMPPGDSDEGLQVADGLRETHPDIGVVVISQFAEPRYSLALLDKGSDRRAYLLKERIQHRGQLVSAIRSVAEGGSVIDAKVIEDLTSRELEILAFIARGYNNQAIADELFLTKRAVEKHINAIFLKLGLTDLTDVSHRVKATLIYLAESDPG
jgi:DNA-binding NarL/FixJ family response regulator